MIETKFGNANIDTKGHYKITSAKEGNNKKYLHRLVYEDFWNVKLSKEMDVHHKDGNKLNNEISNLQLLTHGEHSSLHNSGKNHPFYGKHHKVDSFINKSRKNGLPLRVYKSKDKTYAKGFVYKYRYFENYKRKSFVSADINKLHDKVVTNGLEWDWLDYKQEMK